MRRRTRFADLYHSARLHVGLNVNNRSGKVIGHVDSKTVEHMIRKVVNRGSGGMNVVASEGRYRKDARTLYPPEESKIFSVIASSNASCPIFTSAMKKVGAQLAKMGHQDSVLVEVECAGSERDASLVRPNGKTRPLPELRRSTRGRKRKA